MNKKYIIVILIVFIIIYSGVSYLTDTTDKEKLFQEDFDFIISEIERLHPNPYRVISKESFRGEFDSILSKVNELDEEKIIFEVGSAVASLEDGHTSLVWQKYLTDRYYPIQFKIIDDKLYVLNVAEDYDGLKFKEVKRINGHTTRDVIEKIASYCSYENKYYKKFLVESRLMYYDFYKNTGLSSDTNALVLQVENDMDNSNSEYILPIVSRDKAVEFGNNFEWTKNHEGVFYYNYEYDEANEILTVNYNHCIEDESLSFIKFNSELWSFIESNEVDKIVIDLSRNPGGNSRYFQVFLDDFLQSDLNEEGKAYVIIGNRNYSAGTEAAAKLKQFTSATLVGEPTGGSPRMFGNREYIESPNMGINIEVAIDSFDNYPDYKHDAIMPDVLIEKTVNDYQDNTNPITNYIINN